MPDDTIVAISTAPGRAGIGIVRLSGPSSWAVAAQLVQTAAPLEHARARFAKVLDPEAIDPQIAPGVDEAVVTAYRAPRSYTGDDLVEIATHGSPVVLEAVLHGALHAGARLARPGEFTERAFLSGRLDLTQSEAVRDLIEAQTLDQVRTAARQLGGALSRRLAPVKENLLHLIALLEAGMNFASGELDDVDAVASEHITQTLKETVSPLKRLERSFRSGSVRRTGASLALIGLPNAGKSSLFNLLLERDRAIVTPVAGTTRDTLEESFSLNGIPFRLVDTAGLRALPEDGLDPSGHNVIEQLGMARSREAMADADLVLLLHDATQPFTTEECGMAAGFRERPHVLVSTKTDLVSPFRWESADSVAISAIHGHGLNSLLEAVQDRLGLVDSAESGGLNNLRQYKAVRGAIASIEAAGVANDTQLPHEMLLLDLHNALDALDALTGQTTTEDILARVFSTFCIGK